MNWLNIHTPVLRSPAFIGSDPTARATWLYVAAYSCEQENHGRIVGAKAWKDRQWQQTCGVTLPEIEASAPLLSWDGDDLVMLGYPLEKEREIIAKRASGHRGGQARARNENERASSISPSSPSSTPSSSHSSRASTEGEGEGEGEGKEKGKKRKGAAVAAVLPPELDSVEFRAAWSRYEAYRRRKRYSKLLDDSLTEKWSKMAQWGVDVAIEAISETIANGWQGIFPPKAPAHQPTERPIAYAEYIAPLPGPTVAEKLKAQMEAAET